MNAYTYKGKVTCLSKSDNSTVATWFKELTVEAFSQEDAFLKMESELKAEYEDANIKIDHDMQMVNADIRNEAPSGLGSTSTPPADGDGPHRFRI